MANIYKTEIHDNSTKYERWVEEKSQLPRKMTKVLIIVRFLHFLIPSLTMKRIIKSNVINKETL